MREDKIEQVLLGKPSADVVSPMTYDAGLSVVAQACENATYKVDNLDKNKYKTPRFKNHYYANVKLQSRCIE